MAALLRILALWRGRWRSLGLGLLVSLAAVAAAVALMATAGRTVAMAVLAGGLAAGLLLRLIGVARVVLRYGERLLTHDATFRALADLRVWFFRGLATRAAGGLGFRRGGDMLSRLVNDVEALDGLYLRILLPLAAVVLLLPVLLWWFGRRSPWLAAIEVALFLLAGLLLPWLSARGAMAGGGRLAETTAALRVAALDAVSGLREIRAFGAESRMVAQIGQRQSALFRAQRALARHGAITAALAFLCAQAAILAVLATAAWHPLHGRYADAAPMAAITGAFLVVAAFEAIGGLSRAGALAGHAAAAAARVIETAEGTPILPDPAIPAAAPAGSALRFEAVRFRWRDDRPLVLDGLTLDIPEGARVAVLGPSGAGKSTLAALALKIVAPESGRVLLGGVDLATLPAAVVRTRFAWLSQAAHLFDDTIRANLLLARPDAGDAALWAALEAAQIAETVRALPDGLDSWVGEGGARFSGGEGRRLALARALLSPAPVLILDEPCAGLDAPTERAFLTTLNTATQDAAMQGRSVLLIAHRLTGVEVLDRIWRLSGGHAVAAAG